MTSRAPHAELDAHQRPPEALRPIFKKYQRAKQCEIDRIVDEAFLDCSHTILAQQKDVVQCDEPLDANVLSEVFAGFAGCPQSLQASPQKRYEHKHVPGLQILPALLPPEIQVHLLDRLLHRDLTNPQHKTNVHLHYDVQYPATNESFFSMAPTSDERFLDHDKTRPPMSIQSFLCKKLRWCTLGGQYDWTAKRYPDEPSPPFPSDTAELIHGLFPETRAQAAIVNLYTPGDTLSIHRDVSEECGTGLVSISIGCDAIFIAALEDEKFQNGVKHVAVRLRSGDAVYMAGPARFAWHGVPRILEGTCPDWLKDWPAPGFEAWRGWMGSKRINVNIRQMHQSREL